MTYCPKCGEKVKKGDQFCSKCGTPLGGESNYQKHEPQRPQDVWRDCAFCDGTGQDPGDGNPMTGLCGVCKGNKGAYLPEDWRRCKGECGGKGRIPREPVGPFPNYRPCRDCGGIGWAPD